MTSPHDSIEGKPWYKNVTAWIAIIGSITGLIYGVVNFFSSAPLQPTKVLRNIQLVIDTSVHMEAFFDGTTKWGAAVAAVEKNLQVHIAQRDNLALRLFGGLCTGEDIRLAVAFGQKNHRRVRRKLQKVRLDGEAPLAAAVNEAVGDFNRLDRFSGVQKKVVVITGSAPCHLDALPAIQARLQDMEGKDKYLKVDFWFIGLDLSAEAKVQITQIATHTGGRTFFPENLDEVHQAFRVTLRAEKQPPYVDLAIQMDTSQLEIPFSGLQPQSTMHITVVNLGQVRSKPAFLEVAAAGQAVDRVQIPAVAPGARQRINVAVRQDRQITSVAWRIRQDTPDFNPTNDRFTQAVIWQEVEERAPPKELPATASASDAPLPQRGNRRLPEVAPPGVPPTPASEPEVAGVDRHATSTKKMDIDDIEFVYIPAGLFAMGPESVLADRGEGPVHEVEISRSFYLGRYEVTQGQWRALMGNNPSRFQHCGDKCPVENVTWWEAAAFTNALSHHEGLPTCYELRGCSGRPGTGMRCESVRFKGLACEGYRLPTEAEWEYAVRAGTTTAYSFGDDPSELGYYAWYRENAGGRTRPVGQLVPNPWGLYDMHGNVWEWVQDWYGKYDGGDVIDPQGPSVGVNRVLRGGCWFVSGRDARSALRDRVGPGDRDLSSGFRFARGQASSR